MSAWLWKVGAHNEKAGPQFIYGTHDPVVITRPALTSWARNHTASIVSSISNTDHCSSLSIVIPGNRNGLISDSDLEVLRFPHRQDGSGPAWSLDESVISGVERGPLDGSFCV